MELLPEINQVFRLTWKIHNVTSIPYKVGEGLWSPTIVIGIFDATEWNVGLYVKGYKNENYVTGLVYYRGKSEKVGETMPVSLSFFFKNIDGSFSLLHEKNYNFTSNDGHGFQLISTNEILQNKKFLFPGDTLIMECRMRRNIVKTRSSLESCARNFAFDSKFAPEDALDNVKKALQTYVSECRICTHIDVEKLKFIWAIPRFCTIKSYQKLSVPIHFVGKHSPKLVLAVKPKMSAIDEESMDIEISAENEESFHCSYEIMLVDYDHVSRINIKGEHLFEIGTSMSYNVPNSLRFSDIRRNKHLHLVNETLTLHCEFAVTSPSSIKSFFEQTTYSYPNSGVYSLNRITEADMKPNRERKFCDLSLQVEGKLLRTHKIVLCIWSSVFRAILENDLNEDSDCLDIVDADAETIDRMLSFMYTQTIGDLNWKEIAKLYLVANKFKIISLKETCLVMLQSKISVLNVSDLLFLADMHENEGLVEFATNFIKVNKDKVFRTKEWRKLMEGRGAIAAKLMHEMFVKKE